MGSPALDQNCALSLLTGLNGGSYTATVLPLNLYLTMNAPTASVTGTQISGPGYTPGGKTITFGGLAVTSSGAQMANTNAISWTNSGSSVWTVVGYEFWDSAGTPSRKGFGLWSGQPLYIGPGSPFSVAIGAVTWSFP